MYVSLTEAKRHLDKLIARALRGEEIVICRGERPVVRLEPIQAARPKTKVLCRSSRRMAGKFQIHKGTFKPGE